MQILILSCEPSITQMLQMMLEFEGCTVAVTTSAADAVRITEESSDSFVLFADNYFVNEEARQAFTMLQDHPEVRHRVWIVGLAVWSHPAWIVDGLMDEHLSMPFNYAQVIHIIEAHDEHRSDRTL